MALKYPLANGVWSNASNWIGGTVPIAGDDVRANGFTVTIDVDIDVLQISTAQLLPAAAGGSFVVSTNRNITSNIIAGTTTCLSSTVGNIVNIIGNINGGISNSIGVSFTNLSSILNITGNSNAGTGGSFSPNGVSSAGTVIFVGNAVSSVGSSNSNVTAINITGSGNLTFTGNATALGNNSTGISCVGNSVLNGTITGGNVSSAAGVRLGGGVHTINSNCFGGTVSGSHGLLILNSTATVNGNCTGGGTAGSHACNITNSTATFNGDIIGSTSSTSFGLVVSDTASNVVISTMTFSSNGGMPVAGFIKFKNTAPTITVRKANNTNQTLVDPSTTDIPVIGNVRDGITYASSSLTGTLKVPPVNAVSVGVPSDNTVGTAVIDINDMGALLASYVA
jgi:hypothetical protein